MDANGLHPVQLVGGQASSPVVMPGDREVAFLSQKGGQQSPWIVSLDGGAPTRITQMFALGQIDASPDGKPIRQLTHFTDDRRITNYAWSRDGTRLAIARGTTTNDIVLFKGLRR